MMSVCLYLFSFILAQWDDDHSFYKAVRKLEEIHFYIRKDPECISRKVDYPFCRVEKNRDCYYMEIVAPHMPDILPQTISIRQLFIKANYKVKGEYYPRARIREWTLSDSIVAEEVVSCLDSFRYGISSPCTKYQFTYFQVNNKIYFLVSGGDYMMSVFPELFSTFHETVISTFDKMENR